MMVQYLQIWTVRFGVMRLNLPLHLIIPDIKILDYPVYPLIDYNIKICHNCNRWQIFCSFIQCMIPIS